MRDKMTEWIILLVTTLIVPCFITLFIAGTEKKREEVKSGILLEYENGQKVDMEEFLPYMIAGEISLDYEEETLKAQAVIARTNLMRELNGKNEARIADLPINYLTPEKFEASLGQKTKENILSKLEKAVTGTQGEVLLYENNYIEALYHQVSIGTTVSAEEIFGKARPYLIAVTSSQDVESEQYMTIKEMNAQNTLKCLQERGIAQTLTKENILQSVNVTEKTPSGYVKQVGVGQETVTGEQWKELFDLNSANFYLEEYNGNLRMIVLGKGHGIGLSQFGANALALNWKNYKEILEHYYPGTEIKNINDTATNHV